jgi:hypothetical protein
MHLCCDGVLFSPHVRIVHSKRCARGKKCVKHRLCAENRRKCFFRAERVGFSAQEKTRLHARHEQKEKSGNCLLPLRGKQAGEIPRAGQEEGMAVCAQGALKAHAAIA